MQFEITVPEEDRVIAVAAEDCEFIVPGEWYRIEVPGHGTAGQ